MSLKNHTFEDLIFNKINDKPFPFFVIMRFFVIMSLFLVILRAKPEVSINLKLYLKFFGYFAYGSI